MNINIPIMRIAGWVVNIGVPGFIPGISDSDAIKYGTFIKIKQQKSFYYNEYI